MDREPSRSLPAAIYLGYQKEPFPHLTWTVLCVLFFLWQTRDSVRQAFHSTDTNLLLRLGFFLSIIATVILPALVVQSAGYFLGLRISH